MDIVLMSIIDNNNCNNCNYLIYLYCCQSLIMITMITIINEYDTNTETQNIHAPTDLKHKTISYCNIIISHN